MALVYSTEGYFCEGEVVKDWKFEMEFGRIILSELELSLVKKSNINLTEIGSSVDNFKEDFVIPLTQIIKAYSTKIQKIYVVVIETRDGHSFSLTTANERSIGRQGSINLSEIINSTTLLANKTSKNTQNVDDYKVKPPSNKCTKCGEEISYSWKFCKNCGREL
ncbi:MAG: zinc ribbon domain-containing protein [Candidatus Lokiarchaeota archaeon]|nr:zinc ribbon domain-containing protein [Candidatus Lokiarchaeota archaeon]